MLPLAVFVLSLLGAGSLIIVLSFASSAIQQLKLYKRTAEAQKQGNPDYERQGATEQGATARGAGDAVADAINAYHKKRDTYEESQAQRDNVNVIVLSLTGAFALLAASAAIVSNWIFYGQLREMQNEKRAWVGVTGAAIEAPIREGHGVKMKLDYINTGKEPATGVILTYKNGVFSKNDWDDGIAAQTINTVASQCFFLPDTLPTAQSLFPSAQYITHLNTNSESLAPFQRVKATEGIIDGSGYLAVIVCSIYRSLNVTHHSSFCIFYNAKQTDPAHLSFCTVGNKAD